MPTVTFDNPNGGAPAVVDVDHAPSAAELEQLGKVVQDHWASQGQAHTLSAPAQNYGPMAGKLVNPSGSSAPAPQTKLPNGDIINHDPGIPGAPLYQAVQNNPSGMKFRQFNAATNTTTVHFNDGSVANFDHAGRPMSAAGVRSAQNMAAARGIPAGQGSDTAPPNVNPWQNNTQDALQAVNNVVTPVANAASAAAQKATKFIGDHAFSDTLNFFGQKPAPSAADLAENARVQANDAGTQKFIGNLASGIPKLAGGIVSAGVGALGGGRDYIAGKQQQMDANGAQYLAGVQQQAGFPAAATANQQQAATLRANSTANLKSAGQVGGAFLQGLTGGPNGGPAQAYKALKYLGAGDLHAANVQAQSVATMAGHHFLENPVDAVAILAGGAGIAGGIAEKLAAGGDIMASQLLKSAAAASAKGDGAAATAALAKASQFQAASAKLRVGAVGANTVANPFHSQAPAVANNAATAAESQADLLHAQANIQGQQGNIPGAHQSITKAAQLQEQANAIRTAQGTPKPATGTAAPQQVAPQRQVVGKVAPPEIPNAGAPTPMKMVTAAPLTGGRTVLPSTGRDPIAGGYVGAGKSIAPETLNNGVPKAAPILPIVRVKNVTADVVKGAAQNVPAPAPLTQQGKEAAPVEPAHFSTTQPRDDGGKFNGPPNTTPAETPTAHAQPPEAATATATPEPAATVSAATPRAKSEYAGSVNLDRSGMSDADKATTRADAERLGLGGKTPQTHAETITGANALNITPEQLRKLTPGEVPTGIDPTHFDTHLGNLHAGLQKKVRDLTADAGPTPTDTQKAQITQAQADRDTVTIHNNARARIGGQTLSARNILRTPSVSEAVQAKIQATPSLSDLNPKQKPAMKVTTGQPVNPKVKTYGAKNKIVTKDVYNQDIADAKDWLKELSKQTNSIIGGIDPSIVPKLARIAAFHIEAGARTFTDFSKAMTESLGHKLDDADLMAIYAHGKTEYAEGVKKNLHDTALDVFPDHLAKKFGSRANASKFVTYLHNQEGGAEAWDAIIHKKPMTPEQGQLMADAAEAAKRDPKDIKPPPPSRDAINTLNKILADQKEAATGTATTSTPADKLHRYFKGTLGEPGANALRAKLGPDAYNRLATGAAPPHELQAAATNYEAIRKALPKPASANPLFKPQGFGEALAAHRKALAQAAAEEKAAGVTAAKTVATNDPMTIFKRTAASRVGAKNVDAYIKKINATPEGRSALAKISAHDIGNLTDTERLRIAQGYDGLKRPRVPAESHPIVREVRSIMADARAGRLNYDDPRDMARDYLTKGVEDPKEIAAISKEVEGVHKNPDGTVSDKGRHQLAEIINRRANLGLSGSLSAAMKSGLLSGPATLGKIALSHILSTATEDIVNRPIAAALSRGTVQGLSLRDTGGATLHGLTHGAKGALEILRHGDNSLALKGHSGFANPSKPFRGEFTSRSAPLNAAVRAPMRVHGALYHMIGSSIYDRALREAASLIANKEKRAGTLLSGTVQQRVKRLYEAPTKEMMDHAREQYNLGMFQNENRPNTMLLPLKSNAITNAITDVAAPFTKIPSNIAGRSLEYTIPGAGLSASIQLTDAMKAAGKGVPISDAAKANIARTGSRAVTGTMLTALGYELLRHHILNAPDEKSHEYGSINVGGRKYDINGLGPISSPLMLGGSIAAARDKSANNIPVNIPGMAPNYMAEQPMMRAGQTMSDFKDGKGSSVQRTIGSAAGMLVPTLFSQTAASMDPTHSIRQKASALDYVKNRVPGLRNTLPLQRTTEGNTIPEAGGLLAPLRNVPNKPPTPFERLQQEVAATKDHLAQSQPMTHQEERNRKIESKMLKLAGRPLIPYYAAQTNARIGDPVKTPTPIAAQRAQRLIAILQKARAGTLRK